MADIFLSYARADQPSAAKIAAALESAGHSVWWDQHLASGHDFSEDIERELADAKAVVVLWSATSVKSHWVRDEASFGQRENKLIPASIDGTEPPMGFRQLHTTDLDPDEPAAFAAAVSAFLSGSAPVPSPYESKPTKEKKKISPWAIAGIAAISVAGATGFLNPNRWDRMLGLDETSDVAMREISLAIIPLSTLGNDDISYLGEGISGSITNDLARLQGLQLTANASVNAVAGKGLTADQIGDQLGVSHFVEGQLNQDGDEMRAEISLIDTANGRQIWNKSYRRNQNAIQSMQADMASDLAAALQSRLGVGAGRINTTANVDPRAFEAYLRGREAQTRRNDITKRRQAYTEYRRAVSIAPDFADAQAGLAYILVVSGGRDDLNMSQEELQRQYIEAQAAVDRLDPDNLLGRAAKSFGQVRYEADLEGAAQTAQSILDEVPDYAPALYSRGRVHLMRGENLDARTMMNAALSRDPFNRNIARGYFQSLQAMSDYSSLSRFVRECEGCDYLNLWWFAALARLGEKADIDRDWPTLRARLEGAGTPSASIEAMAQYLLAIGNGETAPLPRILWENDIQIVHLIAYGGEVDAALDRVAPWYDWVGSWGGFISQFPGRSGLDEAARADPRYHAMFQDDLAAAFLEERRENSEAEYAPVFPVRPYTDG